MSQPLTGDTDPRAVPTGPILSFHLPQSAGASRSSRGSHGPGLVEVPGLQGPSQLLGLHRVCGLRASRCLCVWGCRWPCVGVWVCTCVCAHEHASRGKHMVVPSAQGGLWALESGVTSNLCGASPCAVLEACLSHGAGWCWGSCCGLWSAGLCCGRVQTWCVLEVASVTTGSSSWVSVRAGLPDGQSFFQEWPPSSARVRACWSCSSVIRP